MTTILLVHSHYSEGHLIKVKGQMQELGAPQIRCAWHEGQGVWVALEGCHRLRSAKALGIDPVVINVGTVDDLYATGVNELLENCDDTESYTVGDLAGNLTNDRLIDFDNELVTVSPE